MNSIGMQETLAQTTEDRGAEPNGEVTRLVPMAESIRYRKRAQSAEKQVETLAEQLAEANQRVGQLSQDLEGLQLEQELARKLAEAGANDLEAAVLIAKTRMDGKDKADIDTCVEQLRQEKQYLFDRTARVTISRKTAGAKDRESHSRTVLERTARKAARTGKRADLQEYLKLRRNLL